MLKAAKVFHGVERASRYLIPKVVDAALPGQHVRWWTTEGGDVFTFGFAGDRITHIRAVRNPERLRPWTDDSGQASIAR